MKISEISVEFARDYCGVSDPEEDARIKLCMSAAKAYILSRNGLTEERLDELEDVTAAYLVLVNEMYSNRDYTVERAAENPLVKQILAMHSVNYV